MGNDSVFKNFKKDFKDNLYKDYKGKYHNPDMIIIKGKCHFLFEHSSTGDRKVHIGELLQSYVYSIINECNTFFILLLDNRSKNGPSKEYETERLKYYMDYLINFPKDTNYYFNFRVEYFSDYSSPEKINKLITKIQSEYSDICNMQT
ncbi:MAG: hypothetical protein OEZ22_13900 [Spirochaetia bacterium]|nr:hypothetical protein [Spirochaetia bacterium]